MRDWQQDDRSWRLEASISISIIEIKGKQDRSFFDLLEIVER